MLMVGVASGSLQAAYGQPTGELTAQESLLPAYTCFSSSLAEGVIWNSKSLANSAKLLLFQLCQEFGSLA